MNYKIKDTVKIVDKDECFTTYSSAFKRLGFKNTETNLSDGLIGRIGYIFGIERDVLAVRFKDGREVLVGKKGVKKDMKQVSLNTDQAKELYSLNKELRTTVLKDFTDEELGIELELRDWEDCVIRLGEFYLCIAGDVLKDRTIRKIRSMHLNTPTEKVAKSLLAMAKLSILKADLGEECDLDWTDDNDKYCILSCENKTIVGVLCRVQHFLSFKTRRVADRFLTKHKELITEYFNGLT